MPKNLEIERKYLVGGEFKKLASRSYYIEQGYLSIEKDKTIRIRIKEDKAFITIKGVPKGIERFEWEQEISVEDASELLKLCDKPVIEKRRYIVHHLEWTIEVDEFFGANRGLLLAEIELEDSSQNPEVPEWIGKEVTGNLKYHNSYLSTNPYTKWD